MQLCFVSVHGPRETYFVDEPRIIRISQGSKLDKTCSTHGEEEEKENVYMILVGKPE
jgi:hypothetical protein